MNAQTTTSSPLVTWRFSRDGEHAESIVRLPHDAMLRGSRSPDNPGGADTAYFAGGRYRYRTWWEAPPEDAGRPVILHFDGVQGDAVVSINGIQAGTVRSGYFETEIPIHHLLRWGEANEIEVDIDHRAQPDGRWYPGSGLYRPVRVITRARIHFVRDGVRLRTRTATAEYAEVEISTQLEGPDVSPDVRVRLAILDRGTEVSAAVVHGPISRATLRIDRPRLWSAQTPELYTLVATALHGDEVIDSRSERVGLRTVDVDAVRGLRINGDSVKLRGACIHHDNGLLGAATHRSAERRRVRALKKAGFNAIRSAHHPMSRELLDACDEFGMYVLDEFADYWYARKSRHDHSDRFLDTWEKDALAMIAKDRNRASVIMYAIGNEIPESATEAGVALAGRIADVFRRHDTDRPVTLAVNLFLNALVRMGASPYKHRGDGETMAGSTEANVMINQIGRMMNVVSRLPQADKASRDAFATVDIAGYNYGLGRYRGDIRRYPQRVILGTETLPGDVAKAWQLVSKHPAVIGDFVWTGWEYLGEVGVAVWVEGKRAGLTKPYPYIVSGPGMHDLMGRPDASLRLAQAAWGELDDPAIAVRPLDLAGQQMVRSAWRVTNAVESWAWRGCDGTPAEVEVYCSADEVELWLNGRLLGRRRTGRKGGFLARFTTTYQRGTLTAIAYRRGVEVGKSTLRSADTELRVRTRPDVHTLDAAHDDLAFIDIELCDRDGVVEMLADEMISVRVEGPAELIALGSAAPATEESYLSPSHLTFRGRAQAIIRPTGEPGIAAVHVDGRSSSDEISLMITRSDSVIATTSARD